MRIVFATHNLHKLDEINDSLNSILPGRFDLINLREIGIDEELPETMNTLEGNAIQKARYVYDKHPIICFADDTGLEVYALNNRPGVFSARYAGEGCSFNDNIDKLLTETKGMPDRRARFRTVIALIFKGDTFLFEGVIEGMILDSKRGKSGFGYDPVFQPEGYQQTFAEMSLSTKNMISHRAIAVRKLIDFLTSQNFLENSEP